MRRYFLQADPIRENFESKSQFPQQKVLAGTQNRPLEVEEIWHTPSNDDGGADGELPENGRQTTNTSAIGVGLES